MANLTLEDIAKKTGVSRSTVSRVVNNQPNVREDVRLRVLEVIESTGYHPNLAARSLASQRSSMIGLVLLRSVSSFFTDPYFPRLVQGIAQRCNYYDNTLGLFLVETKEDEEKIFPRVSRSGMLDGIIVQAGHHGDPLMDRLMKSEIPLVFVGRPFHSDTVSYLDIENVEGSYTAVSHLLNLGRQRVATIAGPRESTVGIDRKQGYLNAMKERSIPVNEDLITEGDFSEESGYQAMKRLFPSHPDAVFAASDMMAAGAIRAIRESGLKVPEDIAIVGFDDLPMNIPINPFLTTIRQPIYRFGVSAVDTLMDQINNRISEPQRVIMKTELVIRESCGALKERTVR
ncbi:MAG: LacI family DNA-binding transcriptional regulator [Anaerolineales bacterium]|nr:LacI family DNA-binding transcriptional regulator [Anaerolineales bacterium]